MTTDLDMALDQAAEKKYKFYKTQKRIEQLEKQLQVENETLVALETVFDKETKDVERLEKVSIYSLFYEFLGKKDQQLDKELQEQLKARLQFEAAKNAVKISTKELQNLQYDLKILADSEQIFDALLKEKESYILQNQPEIATKIREFDKQIADLRSQIIEIKEAIQVGRKAEKLLEGMNNYLRSAKNWGTYDILGGGLLADINKYSKIDKARALSYEAKRALIRFQDELQDTPIQFGEALNIDGFNVFMDYFFDNLITDWLVQQKIENSLTNVWNYRLKISDIITKLVSKQVEAEKVLFDKTNLLTDLIVQTR